MVQMKFICMQILSCSAKLKNYQIELNIAISRPREVFSTFV